MMDGQGLAHAFTAGQTQVHLLRGDCVAALYSLPRGSVDFVFADPPYFLSTLTGTTCKSGARVRVHKGAWDAPTTPEQQRTFSILWMAAVRHVLTDTGTLIVSGTAHSIHDVYVAATAGLGMALINEITWIKPNPPPNLACRSLTHATETLLWLRMRPKARHFFNYKASREYTGKQMLSAWTGIYPPGKAERARGGKHPTQKPVAIVARCLRIACPEGGVALDPFNGSGTSGEAAVQAGLAGYIGLDLDQGYLDATASRLEGLPAPRVIPGPIVLASAPPAAIGALHPRA
jgi:site-specific DNA-methyltransferase (adenine-specific)